MSSHKSHLSASIARVANEHLDVVYRALCSKFSRIVGIVRKPFLLSLLLSLRHNPGVLFCPKVVCWKAVCPDSVCLDDGYPESEVLTEGECFGSSVKDRVPIGWFLLE